MRASILAIVVEVSGTLDKDARLRVQALRLIVGGHARVAPRLVAGRHVPLLKVLALCVVECDVLRGLGCELFEELVVPVELGQVRVTVEGHAHSEGEGEGDGDGDGEGEGEGEGEDECLGKCLGLAVHTS
jgi:hypothetical protein